MLGLAQDSMHKINVLSQKLSWKHSYLKCALDLITLFPHSINIIEIRIDQLFAKA